MDKIFTEIESAPYPEISWTCPWFSHGPFPCPCLCPYPCLGPSLCSPFLCLDHALSPSPSLLLCCGQRPFLPGPCLAHVYRDLCPCLPSLCQIPQKADFKKEQRTKKEKEKALNSSVHVFSAKVLIGSLLLRLLTRAARRSNRLQGKGNTFISQLF